jgi:hypothetical protein
MNLSTYDQEIEAKDCRVSFEPVFETALLVQASPWTETRRSASTFHIFVIGSILRKGWRSRAREQYLLQH